MSGLGSKVAKAALRTKDVRVVLDGALAAERETLMVAVEKAGDNQRLAAPALKQALDDLRAWEESHAADVVTVRMRQVPLSEWRLIQRKHPVSKDAGKRDIMDGAHGFAVLDALFEVVEKHALYVDGDKVEQPTVEEWAGFWEVIPSGDAYRLALAMVTLQNESSEQVFGDLVKA